MTGLPGGSRPPSIRDVARVAGVSYQTVSRVINDSPAVSDRSRARVLDAISSLDFHPSSAARAFSTGRGHDLAVIGNGLDSFGWQEILFGIQMGAHSSSRGVVLHDLEDPAAAVAWLKSQTVFGTLVFGGTPGVAQLLDLLKPTRPLIGVGDRPHASQRWLSFREYEGARSAGELLFTLGHRRFTIVSTPPLQHTPRHDAWRDLQAVHGIDPDVRVIGARPEDAYAMGAQLGTEPSISAIVCGNDQIAIPLMAGLRAAGRSIPQDVSVVGFDDHPLAAYAYPALTTVRQDFRTLGRLAAEALLMGSGDSTELEATLIPRDSASRFATP